ncbi:MAG: Crp/Fnr family transcriptional regulator [Anaerovoracaceae bacterium]
MGNNNFIFEDEFAKYRGLFEKYCPPHLTVAKGIVLCKQCHPSGWMYYLVDGVAKVHITNYEGTECIIDIMKKNTIIGMDCITPSLKSVVSISSVTDMQVLPFTTEMLKQMLAENSELAYDMLLYYGKVLRQVTYNLGSQGIRDLTTRLANFLFFFTDTPGYLESGKIELTQDEIAAAINISRAQVAKICSVFRKEGIIETGNRYISVIDIGKLSAYCRF